MSQHYDGYAVANDGDGKRKKFIGGAERARREARKPNKFANKNNEKHSQKKHKTKKNTNSFFLPKSLKASERFFGSLFLSSVSDIALSNESVELRKKVMNEACNRVGLPLPEKLPSTYRDNHHFFSMRASLVLEETRHVVSEALLKKQNYDYQPQQQHHHHQRRRRTAATPSLIHVDLASAQKRERTEHLVLTFKKSNGQQWQSYYGNNRKSYDNSRSLSSSFTTEELYSMRPGGVFQVFFPSPVQNGAGHNEISVLGSILPQSPLNIEESNKNSTVPILIYRTKNILPERLSKENWKIVPITTMVSHMRQFEACTNIKHKLPFLPKLLAWKKPTHTRFENSDEDDEKEEVFGFVDDDGNEEAVQIAKEYRKLGPQTSPEEIFDLPTLNATQEKAAKAFLESPPSTLSLVQGPPGTGKTYFMVSVIARSLLQQWETGEKRRILVTAPTNKAISVLASRFLDSMIDGVTAPSSSSTPFNIVMIGVEDKLLGESDNENSQHPDDDPFSISSLSLPLRRIFVYTWLDSMIRDLKTLRHDIYSGDSSISVMNKAKQLSTRLTTSIPILAESSGTKVIACEFVNTLGETISTPARLEALDQLIEKVATINKNDATHELLASADVIFSTLSTAGVSTMKRTRRIDDLFVDEAAACTEPELCIPFHLGPKRMLAVGDPMQLPALVQSKHAVELGLAKSMHERLMFECANEHIMLDTQYRMKPDISAFPSKNFYDGKLFDGSNVLQSNYIKDSTVLDRKPYSFVQISGREQQLSSGTYSNVDEAKASVALVQMLRDLHNCASHNVGTKLPWHSHERIRIITFYQGQVMLLKRMLRQAGLGQVLVATVDSSQGCEADVVIISFVRSNNSQGGVRRCAGFLTDDRRINVALTRARHQLICIGNARGTLSQSGAITLKSLVDDAEARNCVFDQKMHSNVSKESVNNKEALLNLPKQAAVRTSDTEESQSGAITLKPLEVNTEARNCVPEKNLHAETLRKRLQESINNKEAQLSIPEEAAVRSSDTEASQSGAMTLKSLEVDTEARNSVPEKNLHAETLRKRPQESANNKEAQLRILEEAAVETPDTEASQSGAMILKSLEVDAETRKCVSEKNLHTAALRKGPQESVNNKEAQLRISEEGAVETPDTEETDDQQQHMCRERSVTEDSVQTKKRRLESLSRYRWSKDRTLILDAKSNKYEYRLKRELQH